MKTTHLWPIWLMLVYLLTSCVTTRHYEGDADYNKDQVVVIATNNLEQVASVRLREDPGTTAHVLKPGKSHQWVVKRQRYITVVGEIYEEYGWSSERVLAEIDRNAWLTNTIEISIDDNRMQGVILQPGYITNYMPWAASFREVNNVYIDILQPGQSSQKLNFPPGKIHLIGTFVAGPYKGQEFSDYLEIDSDPKDANWFDGQQWRKIGWTFPVDENRSNNDWRWRRH